MKITTAAILLFCLSICSAFADVGTRHSETAGGYSLQPPQGWIFHALPGMKYEFAFGPANNGFSPNINVVDEMYRGSLKDYVSLSKASLQKLFVEYKLQGQSHFVTSSGINGEKIITTSLQQKVRLRQIFYFLPDGKDKYFVITCSALASGGGALDASFEESVKSFTFL